MSGRPWCTLFQGIPTVNEMFTVQTTALNQGGGCRENTRPILGRVLEMTFYAVVICDSIASQDFSL